MKAIENISPVLEKIILKGLDISDISTHLELFQAIISIYKFEDTLFIYFQNLNTYLNKPKTNIYEVRLNENYYLFETIDTIVKDLDTYGSEPGKQNAFKIFSFVIDFCKKINMDHKDFETAINKLNK